MVLVRERGKGGRGTGNGRRGEGKREEGRRKEKLCGIDTCIQTYRIAQIAEGGNRFSGVSCWYVCALRVGRLVDQLVGWLAGWGCLIILPTYLSK